MSFYDERMILRGEFGPAYDKRIDGTRLQTQCDCIREWMLRHGWTTLQEIKQALGYPESSISAQLRHLRKEEFGSFTVEKRRRDGEGTWEYRVSLPPARGQFEMFREGM